MQDALNQLAGTILATGGMGFIGSNFVRYLLREHPAARVVNLDKVTYAGNPRNLADVAGDSRYAFVRADICDDGQVAELARAAQERLGGPVAVLVNNAGTYLPNRFLDYAMSDWEMLLRVNVLGTVRVTRAFLGGMVQQRHGRIINIASTAGKYGSDTKASRSWEVSPREDERKLGGALQ